MAAPSARMRLTVEVLPLAAENAYGPYQARAMAEFKARKFALPVRSRDTLELVWSQIKQRYKKNYLDAQQAACFTIKKLQDAYDCDLDLGDTVRDIFEGETDPAMRLVRVVPAVVNRDFSVPPTSNLRPAHEQKRARESRESRELTVESTNKRRRTDDGERLRSQDEADKTRDQPLPSRESEPRAVSRTTRSHTHASLEFVHDAQTGHAEFGAAVKEESPELGLPPPQHAAHKSLSKTPPASVHVTPPPAAAKRRDIYELPSSSEERRRSQPFKKPPPAAAKRKGIPDLPSFSEDRRRSQSSTKPAPAAKRNNLCHLPSSSEERRRSQSSEKPPPGSVVRTPSTVQKEVDLLNGSRQSVRRSSDLTTAFLNDAHVPSKPTPPKTLDSDIQARLDRVLRLRRERNSRPAKKTAVVESRSTALEEPAKAAVKVPAKAAMKEPAEEAVEEPAEEAVEEPASVSQDNARPKSPSAGAVVSPPSSPAVSHHAARFLSHSPTAEVEEQDADENESSSDTDGSSSEDGTEDEDEDAQPPATANEEVQVPDASLHEEVELPDAPSHDEAETPDASADDNVGTPEASVDEGAEMLDTIPDGSEQVEIPDANNDAPSSAPAESAAIHLPSSPPRLNGALASTPRVPESSQLTPSQLKPSQLKPTYRQTPIPLPSNLSRTPLSSQTTSAKPTSQRPSARYTNLRTLREQLADAEMTPLANGGKSYDPRTVDVTKLVAKGPGKPAMGTQLGVDDDSDDDSSSSSSSSDSD